MLKLLNFSDQLCLLLIYGIVSDCTLLATMVLVGGHPTEEGLDRNHWHDSLDTVD